MRPAYSWKGWGRWWAAVPARGSWRSTPGGRPRSTKSKNRDCFTARKSRIPPCTCGKRHSNRAKQQSSLSGLGACVAGWIVPHVSRINKTPNPHWMLNEISNYFYTVPNWELFTRILLSSQVGSLHYRRWPTVFLSDSEKNFHGGWAVTFEFFSVFDEQLQGVRFENTPGMGTLPGGLASRKKPIMVFGEGLQRCKFWPSWAANYISTCYDGRLLRFSSCPGKRHLRHLFHSQCYL